MAASRQRHPLPRGHPLYKVRTLPITTATPPSESVHSQCTENNVWKGLS